MGNLHLAGVMSGVVRRKKKMKMRRSRKRRNRGKTMEYQATESLTA